jgi:hypothetical protein
MKLHDRECKMQAARWTCHSSVTANPLQQRCPTVPHVA